MSEGPAKVGSNAPASSHLDEGRTGLNDPRSVQILTAEHFALTSTRSLGYQEMFGRTTIFIAALSGTVITLALLAQATKFGPEILWYALVLICVLLFIGLGTFVRSVVINYEDARWVTGLNRVHQAYLQIVPELGPFFVGDHEAGVDRPPLGYGKGQHIAEVAKSLTTTSSVVATLDSVLAGSLMSAVAALLGWATAAVVVAGFCVPWRRPFCTSVTRLVIDIVIPRQPLRSMQQRTCHDGNPVVHFAMIGMLAYSQSDQFRLL